MPHPGSFAARSARAAALLVMLALPLGASADTDSQVEAAILAFRTPSPTDSSAFRESADQLRQLSAQHVGDPRLMAYAGAATARLARTTLLPWKKIGYAEDGLALLDKALASLRPEHEGAVGAAAPVALETRLVAANTFLALPGFFNRAARGEKLLGALLAHPALASAPDDFRGAVYFLAAEQAREGQRLDEARQYYERVIALKGHDAERARAALGLLKAPQS